MSEGNLSSTAAGSQAVDSSPRNCITSTPRRSHSGDGIFNLQNLNPNTNTQDLAQSRTHVQEILQTLPGVIDFLQHQQEHLHCRDNCMDPHSSGQTDRLSASAQLETPGHRTQHYNESPDMTNPGESVSFVNRLNAQRMEGNGDQASRIPHGWSKTFSGDRSQWQGGGNVFGQQHHLEPPPHKVPKEKKSITTKTFAKGMMDISLLTSNATQLRSIMSNPEHEFYSLLIWLITVSVTLQILSSVLLIMSDFYKTQVKETDRQNQKKRKVLNFLSLALITLVTSLNVLISAFYTPSAGVIGGASSRVNSPQFSSGTLMGNQHTDL